MPTGHLRQLVSFAPSTQDHIPALRIAASVGLPLIVLLVIDRVDLAIYASFGTFTALYARQEPVRDRFRRQCQAAVLLLVCITVGMAMAHLHASAWTVILTCSVIGGVCAALASMLTLRPPGSVFFIFAAGAVGSIPQPASWLDGLGIAGFSAAWALLAGLFGVLLGEGRRGHVAPVPPRWAPFTRDTARYGATFLFVTLIAGTTGYLSGISHPYWAMVAAATSIASPNARARLHRATHRVAGTFVGILITAFVLSQGVQPWHLVVYVILFQFLAEAYVMRNYGFATFFITPLALLMLQLAHPTSSTEILTARLAETAIGGIVAVLFVLVFRTREEKAADTQAIPILRHRAESRHRHGADTPAHLITAPSWEGTPRG